MTRADLGGARAHPLISTEGGEQVEVRLRRVDERELKFSAEAPLVGWRLFRVRFGDHGFALTAPLIHDPDFEWFPSPSITARCYERPHPAPSPRCRCGLYVAVDGTLDSLAGYLADSAHDQAPPVYAEVVCTGRAFLDRRGGEQIPTCFAHDKFRPDRSELTGLRGAEEEPRHRRLEQHGRIEEDDAPRTGSRRRPIDAGRHELAGIGIEALGDMGDPRLDGLQPVGEELRQRDTAPGHRGPCVGSGSKISQRSLSRLLRRIARPAGLPAATGRRVGAEVDDERPHLPLPLHRALGHEHNSRAGCHAS